MNKKQSRVAGAVLGAIATAGVGLVMVPANAAGPAASHVTATPSASNPATGQTFTVSGSVTSAGHGVPATITVKALKSGEWVPLTGASMHTTGSGAYKIRVNLTATGERKLRVVADPDGSAISTSRATFSVSVG